MTNPFEKLMVVSVLYVSSRLKTQSYQGPQGTSILDMVDPV